MTERSDTRKSDLTGNFLTQKTYQSRLLASESGTSESFGTILKSSQRFRSVSPPGKNMEDPWDQLVHLSATSVTEKPAQFNFVTHVFDKYAVLMKDAKALWLEDESGTERVWTFESLRRDSILTAALLKKILFNKLPVQEDDFCIVLVLLPNVPEYWFTLLAALRIGIQFSPGTLQFSASDIAYRIKQARPALILTDGRSQGKINEALGQVDTELRNSVQKLVVGEGSEENGWQSFNTLFREAAVQINPENFQNSEFPFHHPAYVFFTSGTTGSPKMVVHSQGSYGLGNYCSTRHMYLKRGDVHYGISDPGWVAALFCTFGAWNVRACLYVHQMARFSVVKVIELLRTRPITSFFAPPTFIRALLQEPTFVPPFNALHTSSSGGEALTGSLIRRWKQQTGLQLHHLYAQTETTFSVGFEENESEDAESMGRGMYGYRIGIVDSDGNELEAGDKGILAINLKKPPNGLFLGYLSRNELNELKIQRPSIGNWYLSGDIAYKNKEGYMYFVSREDDLIISSAYRIGPSEVEDVLNSHPAVAESAAVAWPNKFRGFVVKSFVVLRNGFEIYSEADIKLDIQNHAKQLTAPYKYPREIEFVNSLPKTPSGKIMRAELRKRAFN